jgi:Major Facilitator Superfamily
LNLNFDSLFLELFGAMIPVHVFGFLYAIFYLKEVKIQEKTAAYDNPAMTEETLNSNNVSTLEIDSQDVKKSERKILNAIAEFFDPQLAIKCISSLLKKRENELRRILIIFMVLHMLSNGVSQGEAQNLFLYVRAKLSWDVSTYVYHNVFTAICGLIGTSFAVGLLSKILKVADIYLVLMSTLLSIICRGIYFGASKTSIFFSGTAVDFTFSVKFLAVRSLISKIVPSDDLSTMFAVMGLFEALAGFVFPIIYPMYYQFLLKTPEHDIAEMFLMSNCFLIIGFFVYM